MRARAATAYGFSASPAQGFFRKPPRRKLVQNHCRAGSSRSRPPTSDASTENARIARSRREKARRS